MLDQETLRSQDLGSGRHQYCEDGAEDPQILDHDCVHRFIFSLPCSTHSQFVTARRRMKSRSCSNCDTICSDQNFRFVRHDVSRTLLLFSFLRLRPLQSHRRRINLSAMKPIPQKVEVG